MITEILLGFILITISQHAVVEAALECFGNPQHPPVETSGDTYEKCTTADCSGKNACATIFQHRYHSGWYQCLTFRNDECIHLNYWWACKWGPRVSSVDPHSTCIRLYEHRYCTGRYIEVKPGSGHHDNLNELSFEDVTVSASSCTRPVIPDSGNNYEKCTKSDCSGKEACVTVFQSKYHGGWYQCLTFQNDECIQLNSWWLDAGSQVSSIDTHDTCIRLYQNRDCTGPNLEFKPGSAHQDYLIGLGFDNWTKSVSSCKRLPEECSVKPEVLFSKTINTREVSQASDEILGTVDDVVSMVSSGFSILIPGLDLFWVV